MSKLYEFVIETRDGEREYSSHNFVIADTQEQADEYAKKYLSTYFGDGVDADDEFGEPVTIQEEDGKVRDESWEVSAELESVNEITYMFVGTADSTQVKRVNFSIVDKPEFQRD